MSDIEGTSEAVATEVKQKAKRYGNMSNTGRMVLDAIKNLGERHGSSYVKIKNYILANNAIDFNRYKPLVKKFIASALAKGIISNISKKPGTQHGLFKIVEVKKNKKKSAKVIDGDEVVSAKEKVAKVATKTKKKAAKVTDETPNDGDKVVPAKKKKIAKVITKNTASPQIKKPKSKSIKTSVAVNGKKKPKETAVDEEQPTSSKAKKAAKPKKKTATDDKQKKEGAKSKKETVAKPKKTASKTDKKASTKDNGPSTN